jgi:hypothetical protein
METKTNQNDYRVQRHQDVFLLMPQNEAASGYFEGYLQDSYFNKNGGLIMLPEFVDQWLEFFANDGWVVSYEK